MIDLHIQWGSIQSIEIGCTESLQQRAYETNQNRDEFDVCVTVHHMWKWREVPTWCNNYDLLS